MSQALNNKLHAAIDTLSDTQKKAVFGIVKELASSQDHWDDDGFVAEMEDRLEEYESGSAKLISLDEVEVKAKKEAQNLHLKKAQ